MTLTAPCPAAGPQPALAIATLRDLGLSRAEIARYFRTDEPTVRLLEAVGECGVPETWTANLSGFDTAQGLSRRQA